MAKKDKTPIILSRFFYFDIPLEKARCPVCGRATLMRVPQQDDSEHFSVACTNCGTVFTQNDVLPRASGGIDDEVDRVFESAREIVANRAPQYLDFFDEFARWFWDIGIRVTLFRAAGEAWYNGQYRVQKSYRRYVLAMLGAGGASVLVNIFAAWLVRCRGMSVYRVWRKDRLVKGAESVETWLRRIREEDCGR